MQMEREVLTLNLDDILPNRFQPRIKFNEKNILELAESIKEHGVIQPIVVRKFGDKYEIIAGERRYKASVLAGKTTIPAIITNLDDKNSAEVALIENVQRQDLTPIEEAVSYKKILDMGYLNQASLAEKLGKTQSTIANKLRLLNLADEVQEALLEEKISERHARSLLKLEKPKQIEMLNRILTERMTVRKTDDEINKMLNGGEIEAPVTSENIISPIKEQITEQTVNPFNHHPQEMPTYVSNDSKVNTDNIEVVDFENSVKSERIADMDTQINNQLNIPSMPIVEEIPTSMNSNEEINNNVENTQNIINPGFVDVDKIQNEAKDVYPTITQEYEPVQPLPEVMETATPLQPLQPITNEQPVTQKISDDSEGNNNGNRFFTMFNKQEENSNYINDIESKEVNMDNLQPKPQNVFEYNPFENSIETTVTKPLEKQTVEQPVINNLEQEISQTYISQPNLENPMAQPILNQSPIPEELTPVNSYSLNDDEEFTTISSQPIENIQPSYNKEPVQPVPLEDMTRDPKAGLPKENVATATVDLKTVINTIRKCSETIESYGYIIDTEELDFEDHYEVNFRIEKQ